MLMTLFIFEGLVFKKEKKRVCCILMFFSTKLLFKTQHDFDSQSKKICFWNVFMIIQFSDFFDSVSIVVILAPGFRFFSAKSAQFPNIYRMKLNKGRFSFGTIIIHFWDKIYQEINFKSHLNRCLMSRNTCLVWFFFNLLVCTHFCNEIERC